LIEVKNSSRGRAHEMQSSGRGSGVVGYNVQVEELAEAIVEQTKELAELDPEFAAQLASQRATKH